MRFLKTSGAVIGMVALAAGCATIAGGGTTQSISIRTEPTPAEFIVRQGGGEEIASGRTPGALVLRRGKDYVVEFRCDGKVVQTLALKRSLNGWVWFNLVFGGLIGFAVDFSNGAAFKLEPVAVVARPQEPRASAASFCPSGAATVELALQAAQFAMEERRVFAIARPGRMLVMNASNKGAINIVSTRTPISAVCVIEPERATAWASEFEGVLAAAPRVAEGITSTVVSQPIGEGFCDVTVTVSTVGGGARTFAITHGRGYSAIEISATTAEVGDFISALRVAADSTRAMTARARP